MTWVIVCYLYLSTHERRKMWKNWQYTIDYIFKESGNRFFNKLFVSFRASFCLDSRFIYYRCDCKLASWFLFQYSALPTWRNNRSKRSVWTLSIHNRLFVKPNNRIKERGKDTMEVANVRYNKKKVRDKLGEMILHLALRGNCPTWLHVTTIGRSDVTYQRVHPARGSQCPHTCNTIY